MSIFGTLKGITQELLDLHVDKPYIKPVSEYAGRDGNGYSVYTITASNYQAAAEKAGHYTVAGPVYKSLTRVGHNKWELRVECNDTNTRTVR